MRDPLCFMIDPMVYIKYTVAGDGSQVVWAVPALYAVHCIIALVTPFLRAAGRTIVCLVVVPPFLCPHYFFSSSSENGWEGGIYELFSRPTGHTLPFHSFFFLFSFFMAQPSLWQSPKEECVGLAIWLTNEPHKSACHREVLSIRNYPPTIRYVYCDTAFSWIQTSD